jgi:HK97 family phage portal protein
MGALTKRVRVRASGIATPEKWLVDWFNGGQESASGVTVTEDTALQASAVFACVKVLAESVSSLPLIMYQRLERGKERANQHPLYGILHDLPNPELTSLELRELLMGHLALRGNAYSELVRDRGGRVREIWPLNPTKMVVKRENKRLIYEYTLPDGTQTPLRPDKVWHIRGFGTDGLTGLSPIGMAREQIGLALALQEFGARFFGQGAHPGLVLSHPKVLSPQAHANLESSLAKKYSGLGKSHRVMVLEEGLTPTQVGIPPEDAQFLESRKFQRAEIASIYRVPLHMIQDLDRSTNNNIEHQSLEFVVHTLRPWLERFEQTIYRDLLTAEERKEYFVEHLVNGLLRGDIKSRYDAYAVARQNGWMSANDIRELENMNPAEGGDRYLVNGNMIPADMAGMQFQQSQGAEGGENDAE